MNYKTIFTDNHTGKCLGLTAKGIKCNRKQLEQSRFCTNHSYYNEYTAEQLTKLIFCGSCTRYRFTNGTKTCDNCCKKIPAKNAKRVKTKTVETDDKKEKKAKIADENYCKGCKCIRDSNDFMLENGKRRKTCIKCRMKDVKNDAKSSDRKKKYKKDNKEKQLEYDASYKKKQREEVGDIEYKKQKAAYMREYRKRKKEIN